MYPVALRKESVDRNSVRRCLMSVVFLVALRKESVDRNTDFLGGAGQLIKVALRKESVDRNHKLNINRPTEPMSLSARRAWIEINVLSQPSKPKACRSPQGERG